MYDNRLHQNSRLHTDAAGFKCYMTNERNFNKLPKCKRRKLIMASRSSNRAAVPEAKGALDKFKYEVANELGVPLSDGYNGDLTSKQNGSVGGYMVKKMIEQQEKQMAGK